jgi:uncharacterized protein YmfQ (DUF2313 family)
MAARFSTADYGNALRALFPRGRVWPNDPDAQQSVFITALAQEYEQLDVDANALLADAFPPTTINLLPEWEETLGLPDPCLGPAPSVGQRQAQVKARFVGSGGQSAAWFIAYAAYLGFTITITVYAPFVTGRGMCGYPLLSSDWAHVWLITIVSGSGSVTQAAFRASASRAGDPLSSGSTTYPVLECEIQKLAPAHTILLFTTP